MGAVLFTRTGQDGPLGAAQGFWHYTVECIFLPAVLHPCHGSFLQVLCAKIAPENLKKDRVHKPPTILQPLHFSFCVASLVG